MNDGLVCSRWCSLGINNEAGCIGIILFRVIQHTVTGLLLRVHTSFQQLGEMTEETG